MGHLIDKYIVDNQDSVISMSSDTGLTDQKQGQSFYGSGTFITEAWFYLRKQGSASGNITVSLFAHSGTFGTSSVGTGSALATSDAVDSSTISTNLSLVKFYFPEGSRYTTTLGTAYVIVVEYSGGSVSNGIQCGYHFNTGRHIGNRIRYKNSAWIAQANDDCIFYVFGDSLDTYTRSLYLKQGFQ